MADYSIYIVEDDPWYGEILQYHLELNPDYKVTRFQKASDCLAKMHLQPDLVTIDFSLPDMRGDKLFEKIREINPQVPVIVISSQDNISVAVDLLKKGVSDYMVKDEAAKDLLWNSIIRIRENQSLKNEVAALREALGQKYAFEKTVIGQSDALKKIFPAMEKAAQTKINVSISGETGTGKEVVAKAIHYNSERKKKNFVAVNMSAIPGELAESELFGHEKGSFTGSAGRKIGKFEEANGGTIFLDEIAETSLALQAKLLRALQEREIVRVGGNETVKLDIRLISATHKNLAEEVKKGNFREDLYFRIMGLPITLPPLREREHDMLILAKHFVDETARENKLGNIQLSQNARTKLLSHSYPGNIRELKAVIELATVMCSGKEINADDINFSEATRNAPVLDLGKTLREHNCDIIGQCLKSNGNDVATTAKILNIGVSTIYKMIKLKEITI